MYWVNRDKERLGIDLLLLLLTRNEKEQYPDLLKADRPTTSYFRENEI